MTTIRYCILFFGLLLSGCGTGESYDPSQIPGTFVGSLYYYEADGSDVGDEVESLTTMNTYTAMIARSGANYKITFDDNGKFDVPDITVELFSIVDGKTGAIRTTDGQDFSSSTAGNNAVGQHPNYIGIDPDLGRVDCKLTLKSNDADSVFFLRLSVVRKF
jgi:hypothetical protein